MRGCLDWQKNGLGEPDEVRQATAAYQAEQDSVQAFIDACCLRHAEVKCAASALFEAYEKFTGDKLMTPKAFGLRLEAKGYQSARGHAGVRLWQGLGLTDAQGR